MPKNHLWSSVRPFHRGLSVQRICAFALLAGLLATGCQPASDGSSDELLRVVTTTGMIADTAQRIAGDDADVEALMPPGTDPHLFKASESDVRRLGEADLILYNGLHLEGKMGEVLEKIARLRPVSAVTDEISRDTLRAPADLATQYDPHVWFDVEMWRGTVEPVTRALIELRPDQREVYEQRAAAYQEELIALDAWVRAEIERLPPERRILVTAHDAFGYFGARYGVEVVGLQGISTLSEAGLKDVERVVDLVVERRVPAIFVESSVPRRSIEAVQAAVQQKGHAVEIGGALFSDSMGPAGTPEGTYPGMVRHNVHTLVKALGAAAAQEETTE